MLKNIYQVDKIKYSEFHFLANSKSEMLFCVISTVEENEMFTSPEKRNAITISVAKMKQTFQKYFK